MNVSTKTERKIIVEMTEEEAQLLHGSLTEVLGVSTRTQTPEYLLFADMKSHLGRTLNN